MNADELSHNITNTNLGAVFEPLQPILDNDIEVRICGSLKKASIGLISSVVGVCEA